MENIAEFYVNYIEPGAKVFFFVFIVLLVIWMVDMMRQPGAHLAMAGTIIQFVWNAIVKTFVWIWMAVLFVFDLFLRGIRLVFATVRDFFTSKI